jgi:LysM repeat protein
MKKSLLLAILFFTCTFVFGQNELLVQSSNKGMFLQHTVKAKENYYSIGRLYHVTPREIEVFNGLDMSHGLSIGQTLHIPLNASNFSQSASNGRPVFYVVEPKEGLYRVSQKNNNVLMVSLRKWNKLSNDKIAPGQKLIVGYLAPAESSVATAPAGEPEKRTVAVQPPVVEKPVAKKEEPVKMEEKKPDPPVSKPSTPAQTVSTAVVGNSNGGYFKPQFEQQVKARPAKTDESAAAGIFKTSSGWQDAKYYALIDHVEPGTIIRIVNPSNNKAVYAKVLGEMSGIRQNQGYDVRISNAAASALDVSDTDKFTVRVDY